MAQVRGHRLRNLRAYDQNSESLEASHFKDRGSARKRKGGGSEGSVLKRTERYYEKATWNRRGKDDTSVPRKFEIEKQIDESNEWRIGHVSKSLK